MKMDSTVPALTKWPEETLQEAPPQVTEQAQTEEQPAKSPWKYNGFVDLGYLHGDFAGCSSVCACSVTCGGASCSVSSGCFVNAGTVESIVIVPDFSLRFPFPLSSANARCGTTMIQTAATTTSQRVFLLGGGKHRAFLLRCAEPISLSDTTMNNSWQRGAAGAAVAGSVGFRGLRRCREMLACAA